MKNYFGVSRDHSASMGGITKAAARDYNATIDVIREQSLAQGIDTIVSVVECGTGHTDKVGRAIVNSSVNALQPLAESAYTANGRGTPLWDSVGELIEMFEKAPDANDPSVSFFIMAITDGEENRSVNWSRARLMEKISTLTKTDRWTFVFRVPRGGARDLVRAGIPEGNILEWDQTNRGVEAATAATREAFTGYYSEMKTGVKSTKKFYANLADVSVKDIQKVLTDISSQVNLWTVSADTQIRPFCEAKSGKDYIKGAAFYQLNKTEEVQDYKKVAIRDRVSGVVYGGDSARDLLQLPRYGTAKVAPGDHGQYDIFLQSTSVNRKLTAGTTMLYWPGA